MMMMIVVVELVTMTSLCYTSLNTGQGSTPETSVSNKNLKI